MIAENYYDSIDDNGSVLYLFTNYGEFFEPVYICVA